MGPLATGATIAISVGVTGAIASRLGLFGLVFDMAEIQTRSKWRRVSASPGAEHEYSPQGMTVLDGDLLVTNHWHGEQSRLYRLDSTTGDVLASTALPSEAKHTSGLAWDGEWLWAVDHVSNRLYRLAVAASFEAGQAVVERTVETGFRGASGLSMLEVDGDQYLALSDFRWTVETVPPLPLGSGHTYVAPLDRVADGRSVREAASLSYPNGGYSQGLAWDGTYLYESCNTVGTDRIDIRDVAPALRGDATVECLGSFEAPGSFVEDLGTDGSRLWTTDEGDYAVYELDALEEVKRRLEV
jgi:glutamine cyclotransferase